MEHKGLSSSLIQGMVASFNKINSIKTDLLWIYLMYIHYLILHL
jgi:hypothetical protein